MIQFHMDNTTTWLDSNIYKFFSSQSEKEGHEQAKVLHSMLNSHHLTDNQVHKIVKTFFVNEYVRLREDTKIFMDRVKSEYKEYHDIAIWFENPE